MSAAAVDPKRQAAAEKRRATLEAKRKQAIIAERDAQRAKRKAEEVVERAINVRSERRYAERDLAVGLPMYEQLVLGGSPIELARRVRAWMITADRSFCSWAQMFSGDVAIGCNVKELLERQGFTDVEWTVDPGTVHYPHRPMQWKCSFHRVAV